jgi:uncharacterized membrane protein YhaH (DUF805 family)
MSVAAALPRLSTSISKGNPMGFAEAVQTVLSKFADFNGRASRPEYWWFFLFQAVVILVLEILGAATSSSIFVILAVLASLALLLPSIAVGIRRLHDTDRPGWWILVGLIPLVGAIILIIFYVQPGTPGANRYGPQPAR